MKDIFRQALRVIVWLGKASNQLEELFVNYLLQDLGRLIKESEFPAIQLYEKFKCRRFDVRWSAFINCMNNPWFAQAWVIQEVAVAEKLEISYGFQYFDWTMFEMVSEICCEPEITSSLQLT